MTAAGWSRSDEPAERRARVRALGSCHIKSTHPPTHPVLT
jgi:hypothetical protein